MTVLEDVRSLIIDLKPRPICDDCIADKLNLTLRQHANHKTREIAKEKMFIREHSECFMCRSQKLVISNVEKLLSNIEYLREDGASKAIYGTRFWGFDPETEPFCGFTHMGTRDKLIRIGKDGDLILVLGTKTNKTAKDDQGRLLGLLEFQRNAFYSRDLLTDETRKKRELFDTDGVFKWPYAVPVIRAWRFLDKPIINKVIGRQLTMAAITDVDTLSQEEVKAVLGQKIFEVKIPETRIVKRQKLLNLAVGLSGRDNVGPLPSEWSKLISRADGPTAAYLFQFGDTDVWKIGISKDLKNRLNALNFSVPVEVIKSQWELRMQQVFRSGMEAYTMEQDLLKTLKQYSTCHERVQCSRNIVESAWINYCGNMA